MIVTVIVVVFDVIVTVVVIVVVVYIVIFIIVTPQIPLQTYLQYLIYLSLNSHLMFSLGPTLKLALRAFWVVPLFLKKYPW